MGCCNGTVADLVNSPPVFLVIPQHADPQHVHHLWKLLIHEGGSDYRKKCNSKEKEEKMVLYHTVFNCIS